MKVISQAILLLFLFNGCKQAADHTSTVRNLPHEEVKRIYSKAVEDSFSVFISPPPEISKDSSYPVIYVLDANFYFDMLTGIQSKYTELGILPPFYLVGIGYKDFFQMDTLRDRDYTYPVALAEDSFTVSGGGEKFLRFIKEELIPEIDKSYPVNKERRILMGHSLGGYFTLYALKNNRDHCFQHFIAASPSLEYCHYYLFDQFEKQQNDNKGTKVFVTFGGLEDTEAEDLPETKMYLKSEEALSKLENILRKEKSKQPILKTTIYSNMEHMETPLPSFMRGMLWTLNPEE